MCSLVAMLNNPIGHLLSFFSAIAPYLVMIITIDSWKQEISGSYFSEDKERGLGFLTILVLHICLLL